MKVLQGSGPISAKIFKPVLTLGNFDGVHLGHRKIFKDVVSRAKKIGGSAVVYTYEPHPAKVVAPVSGLKLLQTKVQKLSALEDAGIDICILESFTKKFAMMSPKKFFDKIILRNIKPLEIVIGYDFTFGQKRAGTVELLEKLCVQNSIKFKLVGAKFCGNTLISSTQIRKFVSQGDMLGACKLLGRPYSIVGKVVKGRGIGRELGIHTANLKVLNELLPQPGVYATKVKERVAVTNIGFNPTFGGGSLSVETHIIGFKGTLYGKMIEVEFYKRLRDEKMFASIEALKEQIKSDIKEALKL